MPPTLTVNSLSPTGCSTPETTDHVAQEPLSSNPVTIPGVLASQTQTDGQSLGYMSGSLSSSLSSSPAEASSNGIVYYQPYMQAGVMGLPLNQTGQVSHCAQHFNYPVQPKPVSTAPRHVVVSAAIPNIADFNGQVDATPQYVYTSSCCIQNTNGQAPVYAPTDPAYVTSEPNGQTPAYAANEPAYISSGSEMSPLHVQIPPVTSALPPAVATTSAPVQTSPHHSVTTNMEVVWHSEFDRLFRSMSPHHRWFLIPCLTPPHDHCNVFKDSAKVRFSCKCGNGWTSMKGRVMFWFYFDTNACTGFVYFRLYGQKCTKCEDEEFTHALWYPEEVLKVLANVNNRVGQVYYSWSRPTQHQARRPGKPRNPHNTKLCQACAEGICREEPIVR